MKKFNDLPKSIKKAVRFIYQDASTKQLEEIQKVINLAIDQRLKEEK
jgi:hypothetical protein